MSAKLIVKGSKNTPTELPRGAAIPKEGDVVNIILRGEKKEKAYEVYLIEHNFDFNLALPVGNTLITLVPLKLKE